MPTETDPLAAQATTVLIFGPLEILVQHPEIGRKVHFGQRELVISRGRTGQLALRHQRESWLHESVVFKGRP